MKRSTFFALVDSTIPAPWAMLLGPLSRYRRDVDPAVLSRRYGKREVDWRYIVLPCRAGKGDITPTIYPFSLTEAAYTGTGLRLRAQLLKAGATAHVCGDSEFSVRFPLTLWAGVSRIVRPYQRRKGSSTAFKKAEIVRSTIGINDETATNSEETDITTDPP